MIDRKTKRAFKETSDSLTKLGAFELIREDRWRSKTNFVDDVRQDVQGEIMQEISRTKKHRGGLVDELLLKLYEMCISLTATAVWSSY